MPGKVNRELQEMAKVLDVELAKIYGAEMGFCLLIFPFHSPSIANYLSNGSRSDMIKALRETADRLELKQDKPREGEVL